MRVARFTLLLIGLAAIDEFASGVPGLGAPGFRTDFGLTHGEAAGWTLFALIALSLVVEPPLMLLSDRWGKRRFVLGGLIALAVACALAAVAPTYSVLLIALLIYGPASGVGIGMGQAALMDLRPQERERSMLRWTRMGYVGDIATPAAFAGLYLLGLGWRSCFALGALLFAGWAALLWRAPLHAPAPSDDDPSLLEAFRGALRTPGLLLWLTAAACCTFLDEILVAFGSLQLGEVLGANPAERSLVFGAYMVGGVIGLSLQERLLPRVSTRTLLIASCLGTAFFYVAWLNAPTIGWSAALLTLCGVCGAPLYPISKAQAYRTLPSASGSVNAVAQIFVTVDLLAPLALGWIADHRGLLVALVFLLIQPAGVLLVALGSRSWR